MCDFGDASNASNEVVRGFAVYVGLSEAKAGADGVRLCQLMHRLERLVSELEPRAQSEWSLARVSVGAAGSDLEVVRRVFSAQHGASERPDATVTPTKGIRIDRHRRIVCVDGRDSELTPQDFALFDYFISHAGQTVTRAELSRALHFGDGLIRLRSIDAAVRRLRHKLDPYRAIIRTQRNVGYRYDLHADIAAMNIRPAGDG